MPVVNQQLFSLLNYYSAIIINYIYYYLNLLNYSLLNYIIIHFTVVNLKKQLFEVS